MTSYDMTVYLAIMHVACSLGNLEQEPTRFGLGHATPPLVQFHHGLQGSKQWLVQVKG
jgi:hypothetical protein